METDQTQFLQTQKEPKPACKWCKALNKDVNPELLYKYTFPQTNLGEWRFQFPDIVPHCVWRYASTNMNGVWQILHNIDNINMVLHPIMIMSEIKYEPNKPGKSTNLLQMFKGSWHQISLGHKLGHRLHINESFPNLLLTVEEDCCLTLKRRLGHTVKPRPNSF